MIQLDESAKLLSTYGIALSFLDETKSPMTPDSLAWTLTDRDGDIINNRDNVIVPSEDLDTTVTIVLEDQDLQAHPSGEGRILFVSAAYTSTLGAGKPLKEWIHFTVGQ